MRQHFGKWHSSFVDVDFGQAHRVTVSWGDGSFDVIDLAPDVFTFTLTHQFDVIGLDAALMPIVVMIADLTVERAPDLIRDPGRVVGPGTITGNVENKGILEVTGGDLKIGGNYKQQFRDSIFLVGIGPKESKISTLIIAGTATLTAGKVEVSKPADFELKQGQKFEIMTYDRLIDDFGLTPPKSPADDLFYQLDARRFRLLLEVKKKAK